MSLKFNSPVCTRLSEIWTNTKTETEFPVDTGTTITVSCQEGYINTGSKIVTCNPCTISLPPDDHLKTTKMLNFNRFCYEASNILIG